jgi:hypothetical protein
MELKQYTLHVNGEDDVIYHTAEAFTSAVRWYNPDVRNAEEAIEFIKTRHDMKVNVTQVGLDVKLRLTGFTMTDIELALDEAKRVLMAGNQIGFNQNDSGSYEINVDGEELEPLDDLTNDELLDIVQPHLPMSNPEGETIDYFPEYYKEGEQYYRIEVKPGDMEGKLSIALYDAHRYYSGDPDPFQEVELDINNSDSLSPR